MTLGVLLVNVEVNVLSFQYCECVWDSHNALKQFRKLSLGKGEMLVKSLDHVENKSFIHFCRMALENRVGCSSPSRKMANTHAYIQHKIT